MSDPHRLQRFVDAQEWVFSDVLAELGAGRKRSHWMWFVFPQIDGLGRSPTARHFATSSMEQAKAYLAHPILGERLRQCTGLVNAVQGRSAFDIFGSPDDIKFYSSMTLFALASSGDALFDTALERYLGGRQDSATLAILSSAPHRKGRLSP